MKMQELPGTDSAGLFELLRKGGLLLSVNNRLAGRLTLEYNEWAEASGLQVWQSPNILPLNTWLKKQFQQIADSGQSNLSLLNEFAEKLLWHSIIEADEYDLYMMKPAAIARPVMQAWTLLKQWNISLHELAESKVPESLALLKWSRRFEKSCMQNNWISPVLLCRKISQTIAERKIALPENIVFAGFEDPNYLHNELAQSLIDAHCQVWQLQQENINRQIILNSYPDIHAELQAASQWAKQQLLSSPEKRIAIVIPSLNENRHWVESLLNETFHPERKSAPPYSQASLFNFSLGLPLTNYPLVHDALLTLELLQKNIRTTSLSKIFNALYLFGHSQKQDISSISFSPVQKTTVDFVLRKHGRHHWSLDALIAFCQRHQSANGSEQFEDLIKRLIQVKTLTENTSQQLSPEEFAVLFYQLWEILGWPGNRILNSHEYQQSERLVKLLKDFRLLQQFKKQLSLTDAIRLLNQLASETIFQEQSSPAPVLVSGLLEAAGQQFDALWLTGMDDQALPSQTSPNPFIPAYLQRKHNVPHCSADREHQYAAQILEQFIANSREMIISHALLDQDKELKASPLVDKLGSIHFQPQAVTEAESCPASHLENYQADYLTALPEHYPARGGTGVVTSQAQCPFKAVALYRLNSSIPEELTEGVSQLDWGLQVHAVLEKVWHKLQDQQQLLTIPANELDAMLESFIDEILQVHRVRRPDLYQQQFFQLEKNRLHKLVHQWLELDRQRKQPFRVIEQEQSKDIEVGNLVLRTQADRIDELASGQRVILDYKTGSSASSKSWQEEAILEPQLPLYSLAEGDQLAALALAQVNEKQCRFSGIAMEEGILPGVSTANLPEADPHESWRQLREQWKNTLTALADAYRSGNTEINPTNCLYCDQAALCRKHESTVQETAED